MQSQDKPKRKPRGKPIQKGETRNPKGRPRSGTSLAEFMRAKLEENGGERLEKLFDALYQKATDPDQPVSAAAEILTRAYGKPAETLNFNDTTNSQRPDSVGDLARRLGGSLSISGAAQTLPD